MVNENDLDTEREKGAGAFGDGVGKETREHSTTSDSAVFDTSKFLRQHFQRTLGSNRINVYMHHPA